MTTSTFCFVLMPFDNEFDDTYKLGVKEPLASMDVIAERVDEQIFHSENILQRIMNQILAADFIVADMTGRNPNVFYEVGFAHAKEKTCILLTRDALDIPFDLKHHRHIVYGDSIQLLRERLQAEVDFVLGQLVARTQPITARLTNQFGILKKTDWSDTADIDLAIDIHNESSRASPEIEAMYFYTGAGWTYSQGNDECASTASDIGEYKLRHFVRCPVRRLQRGGWANIKLNGSKLLATTFGGKKLKGEYRLSGHALLRVVTDAGPFDFKFDLDIEVSEIPF
jgi:nucleoside 2-deoxyribosyltransferase